MALSSISSIPTLKPSNFTTTGIPSLSGSGYAYPPGSEMNRFLDGLNQTTAAASTGPNGQSVIAWAQGLADQAAQRKASGVKSAGTGSTFTTATGGVPASNNLTQVVSMAQNLLQQLVTMLAQLKPAS